MIENLKSRDWFGFFLSVPTPFRFTVLDAVKNYLTDAEFWQAFKDIWLHCENAWEDESLITSLLCRGNPRQMMAKRERAMFDKLPDTISIYRGQSARSLPGMSWSLSRKRAEWFAAHRTAGRRAFCLHGECAQENVLALILERKEREILVLPGDVNILETWPILGVTGHPSYIHTKEFAVKMSKGVINAGKGGAQ